MHRAGKLGGLAAWLGFTLPSAVILTALAIWARDVDLAGAGWVHGLELAAAAVVAAARDRDGANARPRAGAAADRRRGRRGRAARPGRGRPGRRRSSSPGVIGALAFRGSVARAAADDALPDRPPLWRSPPAPASSPCSSACRSSPGSARLTLSTWRTRFYRAGALVFGGGHVVLPLLNDAVVDDRAGSRSRRFSPATAPRRPCPGRCSRSRPTSVRSRSRRRTASPAPRSRSSRSSCRRSCCSARCCRSGRPPGSARVVQAAVAGIGAAVVGLLAAALWDPVLRTVRARARRRRLRARCSSASCGSCRRGPSSRSRPRRARCSSRDRCAPRGYELRERRRASCARATRASFSAGSAGCDVEALRPVAAHRRQRVPRGARLDSFGDGLEPELVGEAR